MDQKPSGPPQGGQKPPDMKEIMADYDILIFRYNRKL